MTEYKVSDIWNRLTEKQQELTRICTNGATRVLAYGGARSGKTFLFCLLIVKRAAEYNGSRHLIARLRYSHVRGAIWLDTLREAVKMFGVTADWKESDHYVKIGDSEIWVDGLDDKDRVDKILGREYATIFFNEISQITYPTVTTVMTRLAQKVDSCRNMAFFDCNPPSKFHWSYQLFLQGVDPENSELIKDRDHYAALQINPQDNQENLPAGYIDDVLEHLPEDKRRRFLLGEFGDAQGVIFTDWKLVDEVPDEVLRRGKRSRGLDFGFTVDPTALVDLWLFGDDLYIDELLYADGLTNQDIAAIVHGMEGPEIYADSAEPKSIAELRRAKVNVRGAKKGPDSVRQGIDWLLGKHLYVTKRSASIQAELVNYVWKQNRDGRALSQPIDDFDHAIDAIRYATEPFKRAAVASGVTAERMGL